jgi:phospholipase/carboxylesterase
MTDQMKLNGPSVSPLASGAPQQLVIFLHGVGADGNDLIGLAPYFQKMLPSALFVSPDAPFPFDMAPMGRQWFSLNDVSPPTLLKGVRNAAPALNAFIDEKLAECGLDESRLLLVGFSQGTMMALYAGLRRQKQLAGIIGYSGVLAGSHLLSEEIASYPPVLLTHGALDQVLPAQALDDAKKGLEAVGIDVKSHLRSAMGHSIDEECLRLGVTFAANVFGIPAA